jgi:hypothetical protein
MKDEALKLALEALEEIALAGMSGSGQESEESITAWHARQAWRFIGIAARALEPIKQTLAAKPQTPTQCGACGDMDAAHQAKCTVPTCWVRGEAIAEPVQPVAWQFRLRADWSPNWSLWAYCTKEQYEDYIRLPHTQDWHYEARALCPPAAQPAPVQEPVIQRIMARLAYLLDDDKFNEIEGMVLSAGYSPPAAQPSAPLTEDQCRAGFEAWWSSAPDEPEDAARTYELTDESMSELTKECVWMGWQAAHGIKGGAA